MCRLLNQRRDIAIFECAVLGEQNIPEEDTHHLDSSHFSPSYHHLYRPRGIESASKCPMMPKQDQNIHLQSKNPD
jgi:hypothetical protein